MDKDKFKAIAFSVVMLVACAALAYVFYKVFDSEAHGVLEQIKEGGLHGLSLQDKIWLMELLGTYVFLGILGTSHVIELFLTILAVIQKKEVKETNIWPHAYGFCAVVGSSMLLMMIGQS
ncbi:hypothetical protein [Paraburkholderia sp. C35]|uniref:hypothetical protein n=1 Tax=Paraburkholderia sp. C35 TaxID=2126993 RepID=UPI000D68FD11|nr:hypothetical protein [Paraburkholderia sp. C35]